MHPPPRVSFINIDDVSTKQASPQYEISDLIASHIKPRSCANYSVRSFTTAIPALTPNRVAPALIQAIASSDV